MVTRRMVPWGRRLRVWAGPAAMGGVWLLAAAGAATLAWMQNSGGTTTALAVTRSHALLAPESGWISEVSAVPGQMVEAGATLARIEVPGIAQELVAAEAQVRAVEERVLVEQADRGLKGTREVQRAQRALLAAQVDLAAQRGEIDTLRTELEGLMEPGLASVEAGLELRRVAIRGLEEALRSRLVEVSALEASFREARAGAAISFSGEAELAAAIALRDALRARAAAADVRATTSGVVGSLVPTAGEWTPAGSTLLTITEPVTNEVVAYVAVPFARLLKVGNSIEVLPEGGSVVPGVIAAIGPATELVPAALHPAVPTWAVPVRVVTGAMLVPGETVGVGL